MRAPCALRVNQRAPAEHFHEGGARSVRVKPGYELSGRFGTLLGGDQVDHRSAEQRRVAHPWWEAGPSPLVQASADRSASMCGLTAETDRIRWKKTDPAMRDRMKKLQLGINYGMGVPSLARGLDRHPLIASAIIERHKNKYPRFWEWRAAMVQPLCLIGELRAYLVGRYVSPPVLTSGRSTIFLCNRAALRCCA